LVGALEAGTRMNRRTFYFLTAALTYLLALTIVGATGKDAPEIAATQPSRPAEPAFRVALAAAQGATAQAGAGYVGEATCLGCHEDQAYKGTAHGQAFNERTPAANLGCENCHGPGKAHADSGDPTLIRRFTAISPSEVNATCTSCHDRATHALWDGSQHEQRSLSCITCHSIHSAKGLPLLKAQSQYTLCSTCHRNVINRTFRVNHMPVREGALLCSSCHNVHGTQNVRLLRAGTTIDESCTSCHTDKRGPYLWEHAPVSESCITCHDPHGSNNDRMLVSKLPFLCQRCHVTSRHPPTVYDGFVLQNSQNANKIYGRACTNCHQQVHGSNSPSGKALLR
jgi:DmsE family decaheme c-type cytochrome